LESFEKSKKRKKEVAKMRIDPKSNGIPALKHNHYAASSTPIAGQTDLIILIVSCRETERLTGDTIASTDLLSPEYWR